eukprot:TRINITY_DN586_c0_g3_i1.p1 TRINITY_DN586_c0_g3~~TRINITY_DN586_c0_g3_i1.p1  ORF type:complete len:170 (-),score=35.24 TRINITY_DN586_c0_g3_i1:909-1418(-)
MGCAGSTGNNKKKNTRQTVEDKNKNKKQSSSPQRASSTANSKSSQESAPQEKETDSQAAERAAEEALPLATHPGKVEEYYDYGKVLGSGAFSVVREVFQKGSGVSRAAKCIPKKLVENDQSLLNLRREIKNLKAMDHPNILKLFEVFEDDENFYLIMEKKSKEASCLKK